MRRPRSRLRFTRLSAFTLAEVMTVVAIAGIMASLSMAGLTAITGRARQQRDIDDVEALLRKARNTARSERRCVRVDVTASAITLTPLQHTGGAPFSCAGGRDLVNRRKRVNVGDGVTFTPRPAFFFDRAGGAVVDAQNGEAVGQDVTVTVKSPGSTPRTFTLTSFVGAGAITRRG